MNEINEKLIKFIIGKRNRITMPKNFGEGS
jgi:hypothetical protein